MNLYRKNVIYPSLVDDNKIIKTRDSCAFVVFEVKVDTAVINVTVGHHAYEKINRKSKYYWMLTELVFL